MEIKTTSSSKKIAWLSTDYTTLCPRRQNSSTTKSSLYVEKGVHFSIHLNARIFIGNGKLFCNLWAYFRKVMLVTEQKH
jgi:hypothetical protein